MDTISTLNKLLSESKRFSGTPQGRNIIETVIGKVKIAHSKCNAGQLDYISRVANSAYKFYTKTQSNSLTHNRAIKVYNDEVIKRVKDIESSIEKVIN